MFCKCMKDCILFLVLAVGASVMPCPVYAQKNLENHPALRLYPSPDQWQQRIAAAKRDQPKEYAAAQADFDLAIRSSILLENERNDIYDEYAGIHGRKPMFGSLRHRVWALEDYHRAVDKNKNKELAEWYRIHRDELAVDVTPMLRLVLADVFLNGWDDWSQWEGRDKLDAFRSKVPDPHRHYAWVLALKAKDREYNGIFLRWILEAHKRTDLNLTHMSMKIGGSRNAQVLDYLLQATTLPLPDSTKAELASIAQSIGPGSAEQVPAFRDMWAEYITSPDARVRAQAVFRLGELICRIRIQTKGKDNSDDLQAKLQVIADSDPDKECRARAKFRLEDIRNARWKE